MNQRPTHRRPRPRGQRRTGEFRVIERSRHRRLASGQIGIAIVVAAALLRLTGVSGVPAAADDPTPSAAAAYPRAIDLLALPNAFWLRPSVISGGQPVGSEGFAALQLLGVQTVISVDGARPAVELAARYGLRYVHLPHGYDGISARRARDLAKAVRELPGPLYIHCHHGKHRSPAATATGCILAGLIEPAEGLDFLELAGTSPRYLGLHRAVAQATRIPDAELDQLKVEFRAVEPLPPIADAMVALEHTFDKLRHLRQNRWQPTADQPDLTAVSAALLLKEHLVELERLPDLDAKPADFRAWLAESRQESETLEEQLSNIQGRSELDQHVPTLHACLDAIQARCNQCHEKYRDLTPSPNPGSVR